MGIKNLKKFLDKYAPKSCTNTKFVDYKNVVNKQLIFNKLYVI